MNKDYKINLIGVCIKASNLNIADKKELLMFLEELRTREANNNLQGNLEKWVEDYDT